MQKKNNAKTEKQLNETKSSKSFSRMPEHTEQQLQKGQLVQIMQMFIQIIM